MCQRLLFLARRFQPLVHRDQQLLGNRAVSTNLYFREKNFRIFMMRKFRLAVLAHPEGWECKIFLVAKVLRE